MPRRIAALICVPLLTVYADCVGIAGGAIISHLHPRLFISYGTYIDSMRQALKFKEIAVGLTKSVVFGGIIALISCYVGFKTSGGARGIGVSTTRAVVLSFMLILVADYFLTRILM
jgi:phospholipid/cholesterol/gamma-HCH transport system permease protein